MADAPVSPTGTPLVPASVVPYLLAAAGVIGIVAAVAEAGVLGAQSALIARIAEGLGVLIAVLMGTTPGLRKAAPAVAGPAAAADPAKELNK